MECDVDEELKWNFSCRFTQHPKLLYNLTITINSSNPVIQSNKKTFYDQINRQLCVTVRHLRDNTQKWSGTWNEKFIEQMTNRGGCRLSLKGFAYLLCLGCQHLNMKSDKTLNFVNFNSLSLSLFFPAELGLETVAIKSARQTTQVKDKLYLILSWKKNEKSSAWHFPLPLLLNSDDFTPSFNLQTTRHDDEIALQEGALQKLKTKISNLKKHLQQKKKKPRSSHYKQSLPLKESKKFMNPRIDHDTSTLLSSSLSDSSVSSISSKDVPNTSNVSFHHYAPITNGIEFKPLQRVKSPELASMRDVLRRSRSLSRTLTSLNSRSPYIKERAMRLNSTRTTGGTLQDSYSNALAKPNSVEKKCLRNALNKPYFFSSLNSPQKPFSERILIPSSTTNNADKKYSCHSSTNKNMKTSQSDVFTISFNNVKKASFYRTPSVLVKKPFSSFPVSKKKQDTLRQRDKKNSLTQCLTRENLANARRFPEKSFLTTSNDVMFPEKQTKSWLSRDTFPTKSQSVLTTTVSKKKKSSSSSFLNKKATTVLEKQRLFSESMRQEPCTLHFKGERSHAGRTATFKKYKNIPLGQSAMNPRHTESLSKRNVSCQKMSQFLSSWNTSSHALQKQQKVYCESTDTSEDSYGKISQRIFALQKKLENVKHY
ncbi:uncharacterized protein LOC128884218 isoform X2 [Hylaeus volcanicus]|uniref:uncharacterized protein LOC128884218 isoform X2 n=1 Tax=Hylaeus volcanicus TaxID=313075 RepID=UPI0023B83C46|nr:uncharacterized protein LOC128884218 isoform X2 [Hylaeus volcanicus]